MLLTAHSGSDGTPENRRVFLEEMLANGVAGVEVDVRRSPSGVLYLSHDAAEQYEELVTLEEAFQVIAQDEQCLVNCDLKETQLETEVVNLAKQYGLYDRVILSGTVAIRNLEASEEVGKVFFNPENLFPDFYASFTLADNRISKLISYCKDHGIQTINIHYQLATPSIIECFHQEDIGVSVWTVNDFEGIKHFESLNIRNVTTRRALAYQQRMKKGVSSK